MARRARGGGGRRRDAARAPLRSPPSGPSSRADLAAFTGLAVATLAPALEALEPELERLTDERGRELYDLRGAPRPPADTPAPLRLLGEWDNVLLAHADRTRMFDDETRRQVIRKNGDVLPTILLDGVVAGKWWWRRKKDVATLEATPFVKLTKAARRPTWSGRPSSRSPCSSLLRRGSRSNT